VRVRLENKWGYVNASNEIVPLKFDELPSSLFANFNRMKLNGKYGYLNQSGTEVIPAKYDEAPERISDVLVRVSLNGKYGYLDGKTGQEIIPPMYEMGPVYLYSEKNKVKRDGKWGYIDKQGKETGPFATEPEPCVFAKKNGDHYVFHDQTIMRASLNEPPDIIARLPLGSKIRVLSNSEKEASFGFETDTWYWVESQGKTGFVWGGDLTDSAFTVAVDGTERVLLIRNRTNGINLCANHKFEMKMLLDGRMISQYTGHDSGQAFHDITVRVKSAEYVAMPGFSAPLNLLAVRFDWDGWKDTYARTGTSIVYFDIAYGKLNEVFQFLEQMTGVAEFKSVKIFQEIKLPDNKGRIDRISTRFFFSRDSLPKEPWFDETTLQWDWDKRIFTKH